MRAGKVAGGKWKVICLWLYNEEKLIFDSFSSNAAEVECGFIFI